MPTPSQIVAGAVRAGRAATVKSLDVARVIVSGEARCAGGPWDGKVVEVPFLAACGLQRYTLRKWGARVGVRCLEGGYMFMAKRARLEWIPGGHSVLRRAVQ